MIDTPPRNCGGVTVHPQRLSPITGASAVSRAVLSRGRGPWIRGAVFGFVAGLPAWLEPLHVASRTYFAFLLVLAVILVLDRWTDARLPPQREMSAYATLAVIVLAIMVIGAPDSDAVVWLVNGAFALLVGFLFLLWADPREEVDAPTRFSFDVTAGSAMALAIGVLVALLVVQVLIHGTHNGAQVHDASTDETLYVLQSRLMGQPGFGRAIAPGQEPFFALTHTWIYNGRLRTQYPPGWPALLALSGQARWMLVPLATAITVWLTWLIARRFVDGANALLAALLVACAPLTLEMGVGYLSHAAGATFLVLGAWCLLKYAERGRWWSLAAGTSLSVAVMIRPLTGITVGLSVVLWCLVVRPVLRTRLPTLLGGLALGGMPGAAMFLAYDLATTGHALRVGYAAVEGSLHHLGFGLRGTVTYFGDGLPKPLAATFGWHTAFSNLALRIWDCAAGLFPGAGVLLVLASVRQTLRGRRRFALVLAFLVLPAIHFFFFYSMARFYTELVPFFALGLAALIADCRPRWRAALASYLVVGGLVDAGGRFARLAPTGRQQRDQLAMVARAAEQHGPLTVFVQDSGKIEPLLLSLAWIGGGADAGRVLVARDLGAQDSVLIRAWPGRTPMRARWRVWGEAMALEPMGR